MADFVLQNVGRLLDRRRVEELVRQGVLGEAVTSRRPTVKENFGGRIGPDLDYFPLSNLQRAWVGKVSAALERYFVMFGYERLK